jgi:streptomycin 6-kinase
MASETERAWRARLPGLRDECAEQWSLELGEAFTQGTASLVVPAFLQGGAEAVLKLSFPHRESEHEAEALAGWGGAGAVRLLAHDPERGALLLERCRPGTPLSEVEAGTALETLAGLVSRLAEPASPPFRALVDEAAWWMSFLPERWARSEPELLSAAMDVLASLSRTQREQVLVHQDLHAGNVLRAEREPWLVIDPKPLAGELEFALAPIIRGRELGHSEEAVRRRLDWLSVELGLDHERARGWALGQTLAWAEGEHVEEHLEVARWLLAAA